MTVTPRQSLATSLDPLSSARSRATRFAANGAGGAGAGGATAATHPEEKR